ncbi:MAG: glycosyltransferase [Chloroflexi bacterium]|nr:MAG: glycosyltransferase [Chloroflexota bacterium]
MKRILILTADYGYGHRSAANAIAAALQKTYGKDCSVEIVNPMDDPRAPAVLRDGTNGYDKLVREAPDLYKLGYEVGDTQVISGLVKSGLTVMLFNALREIIHQKQPDVIICTHSSYQDGLSAIFDLEKTHIPVLTVVTDLATVTRLWFHPVVDLCLVPTQTVYDLAIKAGLPPEKVKVVGIPVHPELINGKENQATIRRSLGWREDLFTVLAIGSSRVEHLYDALHVLNHSGFPLQLVVAAGGDEEFYQRCQETEWHVESHIYNFVDQMGTFMRGADCVLGKAGGLTVSEALACGLPLILVDVIPGQETGNANYVVSGNAGMLANDPTEVLEAMAHWLEKDRLHYQQAENARRLGRPRAAFDIAEQIWTLASSREQEQMTL